MTTINQKEFKEFEKRLSLRNWIIISSLASLAILSLFFVVTLSKTGFKDIEFIWSINKNLLIIIPLASCGFGISSFLIQQMSKNRLADTSILGLGNINLIALMIMVYNIDFGNDSSIALYQNLYPFIFIIVSVIGSILIYMLSYNRHSNISKKFIISGVVLNFAFIAISYSINNFLPSNKSTLIKDFSTGFIDTSESTSLYVALSVFIVATIWLACIYEKFKISTTNNQIAKQLGINTNKVYFQILIICGLYVGSCYSIVGNITFLGLFVANMATNIFKKRYAFAIPSTAIIGIIILSLTFFFNKNILGLTINTATLIPIMGIPYFIYLVIKE